jgi:hypothetical protein
LRKPAIRSTISVGLAEAGILATADATGMGASGRMA